MWLKTRSPLIVDIRIIEIHEKDYYLEDYHRIAEEFRKEGEHFSPTMLDSAVYQSVLCGRNLSLREDEDDIDEIKINILYNFGNGKSEVEVKRSIRLIIDAGRFKKRILDNMETRKSSDDILLDEMEEFVRKNRDCHEVLEMYERAIVGVCGGMFHADNVYYDEVMPQRKRHERFLSEYSSFKSNSVEPSSRSTAILNGFAFSHIIQKRDGTVRSPEEAQAVYQSIFDELKKDTSGFHDGFLNILYGFARDSVVYPDEVAGPVYQSFEDQVFEILEKKCSEVGEPEFARKELLHLSATIKGCYFDPLVKDMINTPNKVLMHIMTAMVHFTDRIYDTFSVAVTRDYIDSTVLSHDIRRFMNQYLEQEMDDDDISESRIHYRKQCVGIYQYDPRSEGEEYRQVYSSEEVE